MSNMQFNKYAEAWRAEKKKALMVQAKPRGTIGCDRLTFVTVKLIKQMKEVTSASTPWSNNSPKAEPNDPRTE